MKTYKVIDKKICFDMDGTLGNFYGVEGWLNDLENKNPRPYREAKPLVNMNSLAKQLNRLQGKGYKIQIISWLSKNSNNDFDKKVISVKMAWLKKHLGSVKFDKIDIVPYGTPKHEYGSGVLFDDEEKNRSNWNECKSNVAYDVDNILPILKSL